MGPRPIAILVGPPPARRRSQVAAPAMAVGSAAAEKPPPVAGSLVHEGEAPPHPEVAQDRRLIGARPSALAVASRHIHAPRSEALPQVQEEA